MKVKSSSPQAVVQNRLKHIFSGRAEQQRRLHFLLNEMMSGTGSFVLITGEAGVGKSRFAAEFCSRAGSREILCHSQSFRSVEAANPFSPFYQMLRSLNIEIPDYLQSCIGSVQPDSAESPSAYSSEALYKLQSRGKLLKHFITSKLVEKSKEKPLLISLTDIHLAPLTTWKFLHYLTQSLVDHRIMLIVTLRQDGKVYQEKTIPPYADVLERMNREKLVERIRLDRWLNSEIRQFLFDVFGKMDFENDVVPAISYLSGNLPEQVVETIRILLEEEILYNEKGVWFSWPAEQKEEVVSKLKARLHKNDISFRLKNLSSRQSKILKICALMEQYIDLYLLSEVMNLPHAVVLREIKQLIHKKILSGEGRETVWFKKAACLSQVKQQIRSSARENYYLKMAEVLESADHISFSEKVFRLADYYGATQMSAKAFYYLHLAGDYAVRASALSEARQYYYRAMEIYRKHPEEVEIETMAEILLETVWLERVLGNRKESLNLCAKAREWLPSKIEKDLNSQLLIQEGFCQIWLTRWEEATASFKKSMENEPKKVSFTRAMANYGLGTVHFETSGYPAAAAYYNNALELARKLQVPELEAHILNNMGALENVQGNGFNAVSFYSKSIPIFTRTGNQAGLARVFHNIGMTYSEQEKWAEADRFYGKSLEISDRLGVLPLKAVNFLNRALAHCNLGNLESAVEYNFKAWRLLNQMHDELGLAEYYKIQGMIAREQGDWAQAESALKTARKKFLLLENKLGCAETEYEYARLALYLQDEDQLDYWRLKSMETYRGIGLDEKANLIDQSLRGSSHKLENVQV
ncbi:MAG: tetratricopeptide repeat protein [Calditrichia bacterium]